MRSRSSPQAELEEGPTALRERPDDCLPDQPSRAQREDAGLRAFAITVRLRLPHHLTDDAAYSNQRASALRPVSVSSPSAVTQSDTRSSRSSPSGSLGPGP